MLDINFYKLLQEVAIGGGIGALACIFVAIIIGV